MAVFVLALMIGIIAGLRAMLAPAAISWAAYLGWLSVTGTRFEFLTHAAVPWIFTGLAVIELFTDQLPTTPSRTTPVQFAARLISGGFCGAALGASRGALMGGLIAGLIGAALGTFGGHALRARLASTFGRDRPAAFVEDAIAIGGVIPIMKAFA